MRNSIIALVLFSVASFGAESSDDRGTGFGAGVLVGEQSALTLRASNIQFGLGYVLPSQYVAYLDYLTYFSNAFKTDSPTFNKSFTPFVGFGALVNYVPGNITAGVRIPMGLSWKLPSNPIELFLEISPTVMVVPAVVATANAGLGARYFF